VGNSVREERITVQIDDTYDIVVAGGGPAGLSAAACAAQHGARVLLVEKHAEIGSPTRTSGATFIADMVRLGVPPRLYHPIGRSQFFGPTTEAHFMFDKPVMCVTNVKGLYQWLAEQAIIAGATLRLGTTVQDVSRDETTVLGVQIRDQQGKVRFISCPLIIDATGFSSTVAVKAGMQANYRRVGVGAEADLYAPNFPQDNLVLIVGNRIAPNGYAWAFPYGGHRVRVGVGVTRPEIKADPAEHLDLLLHDYAPLRDAFKGASPVEVHTGVIPVEGAQERLVGNGIMTAGDAAGQSSALVGEGIRYAMYGGRLAGEIAARASAGGDVSANALAPYEAGWRRRFGRNLSVAYIINRQITPYSDVEWDDGVRMLMHLNARTYGQLLASNFSLGLGLRALATRPQLIGALTRTVRRGLTKRAVVPPRPQPAN